MIKQVEQTENWVQFPVLCSESLPVIYFILLTIDP